MSFLSIKENVIKPYFIFDGGFELRLFWNLLILGFFFLPLGIKLSTPLFIGSILVGFFLVYKLRNINTRSDVSFLFYPLLVLIMAFSLVYSEDKNNGFSLLQRILPLFFFPILLIYIKEREEITTKIFKAILLGIVLSFLYNIIHALLKSFSLVEGNLVFDPSIKGGFSFFESFNHGGSHFIGQDFSWFIHPSYLALYILIVFIYFFRKFNLKKKLILSFILIPYLFLLSSRASFVALVLVLVMYVFQVDTLKTKIRFGVVLALCGILFFLFNPRVRTFYQQMMDFSNKPNYNYTTSEQSRILILRSCIQLAKKSPFLGYGIGDANQALLNEYEEKEYLTLSKQKLNAHNQYFQTQLQVGIIGVIFLVSPFFIVLFRKTNFEHKAIVITMMIFLLFESMLLRYNGIIFYAIMVPLLLRRINNSFYKSYN